MFQTVNMINGKGGETVGAAAQLSAPAQVSSPAPQPPPSSPFVHRL